MQSSEKLHSSLLSDSTVPSCNGVCVFFEMFLKIQRKMQKWEFSHKTFKNVKKEVRIFGQDLMWATPRRNRERMAPSFCQRKVCFMKIDEQTWLQWPLQVIEGVGLIPTTEHSEIQVSSSTPAGRVQLFKNDITKHTTTPFIWCMYWMAPGLCIIVCMPSVLLFNLAHATHIQANQLCICVSCIAAATMAPTPSVIRVYLVFKLASALNQVTIMNNKATFLRYG